MCLKISRFHYSILLNFRQFYIYGRQLIVIYFEEFNCVIVGCLQKIKFVNLQ